MSILDNFDANHNLIIKYDALNTLLEIETMLLQVRAELYEDGKNWTSKMVTLEDETQIKIQVELSYSVELAFKDKSGSSRRVQLLGEKVRKYGFVSLLKMQARDLKQGRIEFIELLDSPLLCFGESKKAFVERQAIETARSTRLGR